MDFIREVYYLDWLANVMMVKKANGKWRMGVDFIDLNKACLKDSYPLLQVDVLVDSMAQHQLLSFMNTFFRLQPDQNGRNRLGEDFIRYQPGPLLL